MAFGFERERGTGRGYVNRANPDFEYGQRLSRRQYDAYVGRLGRRSQLPGVEAIRQTDALLRDLERQLEQEENEAGEYQEERAKAMQRRREIETTSPRLAAQGAGQRRYNSMLNAYTNAQRAKGRSVNKRQAAKDPEFRALMADIKAKPRKRDKPADIARRKAAREAAYAKLNMTAAEFWNEYRKMYPGSVKTRGTVQRGYGARYRRR